MLAIPHNCQQPRGEKRTGKGDKGERGVGETTLERKEGKERKSKGGGGGQTNESQVKNCRAPSVRTATDAGQPIRRGNEQ